MKPRHATPKPDWEELIAKLRDLPEGKVGQIVQGELFVSPTPEAAHAHTLGELSANLLAGSAEGEPAPSGWTFLTSVELRISHESLVVADIAGWRAPHDRIAALPTPIELCPAWICEVLDPASRTLDLTSKRRAWALAGVEWLWIVDPASSVLEMFHNVHGHWTLVEAVSDRTIAAAPFENLHFDAGDLWMPAPKSGNGKHKGAHA